MSSELLKAIIKSSEMAANVARSCRQETELLNLLIQQKSENEANPRFDEDFKTLADVLIQEYVKFSLGKKFSEIEPFIMGEESNKFINNLGETIIEATESEDATRKMLMKIFANEEAARKLSRELHKQISHVNTDKAFDVNFEGDTSHVGIWLDPIDATNEYITAEEHNENGIYTRGLRCVTVLIGTYNRKTGEPIMGVVNQPFFLSNENRWQGKCVWGNVNPPTTSIQPVEHNKKIIVSSSESKELKDKLKKKFEVIEAAGSGYKLLCVINGEVDAYVLSKGSTYQWDTCGPHAILKSLGGDIVEYNSALKGDVKSLKYSVDKNSACNLEGLIAWRSKEVFQEIISLLN